MDERFNERRRNNDFIDQQEKTRIEKLKLEKLEKNEKYRVDLDKQLEQHKLEKLRLEQAGFDTKFKKTLRFPPQKNRYFEQIIFYYFATFR